MNYEQALAYIHGLPRFSNGGPTLTRMRELMELLGNPQDKISFIHVAGTNGKGSTATMISSALTYAGYKTGLTISPFILDFCERIQINGSMISHDTLAQAATRVRQFAEKVPDLNEFEVVTAIAYEIFAHEGCDIAVAEVGLGGGCDATNIIKSPVVAVICKIGLDHTEILGDTIAKIAAEKAGIIKRGTRVVTCPEQDTQAVAVLMEVCAKNGCTLVQPNMNAPENVRMALDGSDFVYRGHNIHVPLIGRHQISNSLTAFEACAQAAENGFPKLFSSVDSLKEGFASVRFPARMEILRVSPLVILDGAHNPDGARALAEALPLAGERSLTAVMGMLGDKDSESALSILAPCFRRICCVRPENPRALEAQELSIRAAKFCYGAARAFESFEQAYETALEAARTESGAVVICGSLYLAAQARAYILSGD